MNQPKNISRRNFVIASAAAAACAALPGMAGAQSRPPFKIGSLNSITGTGGPYGSGMLEAIKIGIAEVNAAGGAAGRQFQLFAEDDQTKPDAAVLAVKKLIEINKVDAVLGIWSSSIGLATLPITNAATLISMNTCGSPELLTEDKRDLVWQFQASNAIFGRAFAEAARTRAFKRPAVMAFNNSTFVAQAEYFKRAWEVGGSKVGAHIVYEPNQTSYRTELEKVLKSKPDVIALCSYTPDATIILKEWYQSGQDCKFIMPGWSATPDLVKALGPKVTDGIISISNVAAETHMAFQRFSAAFRKVTGKEPDIFAAESYDMVITLALAIESAGANADTLAINSNIRTVTNAPGTKVSSFLEGRDALRKKVKIDYDGASSSLEFGKFGETVPDFGVSEIVAGAFVRKEVISGKA
jgi:branched-chain amino acid transport system substrate-binding protein